MKHILEKSSISESLLMFVVLHSKKHHIINCNHFDAQIRIEQVMITALSKVIIYFQIIIVKKIMDSCLSRIP